MGKPKNIILKAFSFSIAMVICFSLLLYWITYPELTLIDVFIDYWWCYFIAVWLVFCSAN